MQTVTLYRLSGLAVMIGMTTVGVASVLYSRAGGAGLYLDPLVPVNDLAKLSGSLLFLSGLPGLYAFQATRAGRLGLAGFVLSFFGLAILEVSTEAMFAFAGPVLAGRDDTRFLLQGGLEQNLGGGFLAYFTLSYLVILAGFVSFGFATFRARVYPRWAGLVIMIGCVAAIVMAPLVSVPSGPVRLDRAGVLAASFAFAWCGWCLLRETLPASRANDQAETAIGLSSGQTPLADPSGRSPDPDCRCGTAAAPSARLRPGYRYRRTGPAAVAWLAPAANQGQDPRSRTGACWRRPGGCARRHWPV